MDNSNTLILIAVTLAAVELLAGIAFGWWLRGTRPAPKAVETAETAQAREALNNLNELAYSVAANVGEHSSRVQAISGELAAARLSGVDVDAKVLGSVQQIIDANAKMQQQLDSAKAKLDEQAAIIEQHVAVSKTDSLTGIANRRAFDEQLVQRLCEWQRKGTPVALIMLDVDRFKQCNDTYGHQAGDEVLKMVAQSLVGTMREMDVVARYGGEEFAVIVPSSKLTEALPGAERARKALSQTSTEFDGTRLSVTASFGVSQALPGEDGSSVIRRADEALYAAKKNGRNRVFFHDGQSIKPMNEERMATPAAPTKPKVVPAPAAPVAKSETALAAPHAAVVDELTGLPNRTAFCEDVRRRLAESQQYNTKVSLAMLRIDNLKELVKQHGAATGELTLRWTAKFLSGAIPELNFVGQYDSQTFGMLLPGAGLESATSIADRVRQAISRCPVRTKDSEISLVVSVGVVGSLKGDDSTAILRRAEQATAAATAAGGHCTHCHTGKATFRVESPELASAGA